MAIQTMQLDPNAQSYTDDEIVGKINAAAVNITREDAVESAAIDLSGKDTDDLSEGAGNKYDTGVPPTDTDDLAEGASNKYDTGAPPTDDEVVAAINNASSAITREAALSRDDLKIVKTNPIAGEFPITAIHRQADGKMDIEYDDVAV